MKQRILGVDVGSYSIKVCELERTFKTIDLIRFYEHPIPTHAAGAGEGATEKVEISSLARLFEEYNLDRDSVYTALPGQLTAFRLIELPFSNFKKVDSTIEFEMEDYLPFPLEESVIDYRILESDKAHSKILVSYAQKGSLIRFLNLFAEAELDPRFVGSEPVEIASLREMGVVLPEGAYAIVDLGHEKTNICLFSGKELKSARTIMIGGRDLTKVVAEVLKVPETEAEKIKREMGQVGEGAQSADPMTRQVSEALKGPLGDLTIQLKQTLLAYQDVSGDVVQAILLTGGTSRLPGIDQYFSKGLRKNISFLDCLDIPMNRLPDSQWCRPIAANALAIAYRGFLGARTKDLQFRRGEFAYRGELKDLIGLVRSVGIQVGLISLFVLATFFVSYASLKGKIRAQEGQLANIASEVLPEVPKKSLTGAKNVSSILTGRINEMSDKKKRLEEELSLSVLEILKEVSTAFPPREEVPVDLDDFTVTGGTIRLNGRTNSFEGVDKIKSALTLSPRFQNVSTDNVRKGLKEEVKFDITLELKREEAADGA